MRGDWQGEVKQRAAGKTLAWWGRVRRRDKARRGNAYTREEKDDGVGEKEKVDLVDMREGGGGGKETRWNNIQENIL